VGTRKARSDYKLVTTNLRYYKEIPLDWKFEVLGLTTKLLGGYAFKSEDYVENGINLLKISNVSHGKILWEDKSFLPEDYWNKFSDYQLKIGDVVMAMTRPIISTGLKISFFKENKKTLLNQRVGKFCSSLNKIFIFYFCNLQYFINQIDMRLSESNQPNISSSEVEKMNIWYPENPKEQQQIASILSNVDNLIKSYDKVIESTKKLKKGLMQQLLTKGIGHTKFKKVKSLFGKYEEIPEEWEIKNTSSIMKITMGQSPPSESYNEDQKGLPFYQGVTDFGTMYPNPTVWCTDSRKIAEENSILFSVRAPVGEINLTKTKCCLGRGVAALNPLENDLWYCYYLVNQNKNRFLVFSQGSTYDAINQGEIAKTRLPYTTNIQEQQQIASILSEVDNRISHLEQDKLGIKSLKKGLMQKLLTGQIRVKV